MALPWMHLRADSMTFHFEESIIRGTRATSGSEASRLRKWTISAWVSSRPSSMLMSITCAPSSTCLRAMLSASLYFFSLISRRNLREPATLHRSPTFTKLFSAFTSSSSRPESQSVCGRGAGWWGLYPVASWAKRAMWAGVVPQQPPRMLTSPWSRYSFTSAAMMSGVWSYCPRALGRPALG